MRTAWLPFLLGLASACVAQTQPSAGVYDTIVPDLVVVVKKHPTGADMVTVTMRAADYPKDVLRGLLNNFGRFLGSQPRGVEISDDSGVPGGSELKFTRASFAVDGIIDLSRGTVRLNPIVKSFAGAPSPWTIHAVEIQFQGVTPTNNMPRTWQSNFVPGEGRFDSVADVRLRGISYRIRLLSQDPSQFDIPEPGEKRESGTVKPPADPPFDLSTILVFIVAAAAVGALVYCLLLRVKPKPFK